jgi:hypothetical protein
MLANLANVRVDACRTGRFPLEFGVSRNILYSSGYLKKAGNIGGSCSLSPDVKTVQAVFLNGIISFLARLKAVAIDLDDIYFSKIFNKNSPFGSPQLILLRIAQ